MGNLTYGEITTLGRNQMCEFIKDDINENSVFLDVGSGYGKVPYHIAELLGVESIGIEIDEKKHQLALSTHTSNNKLTNVTLLNGDITKQIHLLNKATILYACNTTWDFKLNNFLLDNFNGIILLLNVTKNKYKEKIRKAKSINVDVTWMKGGNKLYKINTNTIR